MIFRNIAVNHALFDQLRVDHGREFFLMLGIQEHLSHLRRNQNIRRYQQTESNYLEIRVSIGETLAMW